MPPTQLTIEQLMDIDVTTAQRRPEPIRLTPAAISVTSYTISIPSARRPCAPGSRAQRAWVSR